MLLALGCLTSAVGQDRSIIRAIPEATPRVSNRFSYQDRESNQGNSSAQDRPQLQPPILPDQQESPSDQQNRRPLDLKSLQTLDDKSLEQELAEGNIASLFAEGQWPRKGIRAISLDIREKNGKAPEDIAAKLLESRSGQWSSFYAAPKLFCWVAPDIRYQPLYFEDVPLERYGQTRCTPLQTVSSGVHFFTSLALLPLHMRHDPPGSCDYPLGFCRPGDNVPYTIQRQLYGHSTR